MNLDIIAIIAVFIAFVVKGITGFANTLVFGSMMSFSTNTINITPIDLILGFPSNMIIAWRERRNLSLKVILPLALMVIVGSIPGVFFLKLGNAEIIKVLFGIVVVLIGVETLLRESKDQKLHPSRKLLLGIGILSGILCGLFGIGALLVAYISRTTDNPGAFRGNICAVFLFDNVFRIMLYTYTGILTWQLLGATLWLFPVMLIGLGLGMTISRFIKEKVVKKIVVIALIISGIMLMINNIL